MILNVLQISLPFKINPLQELWISTVFQIGFETDADNSPMDLLKVVFLKCRFSKKHEPFYVQYSDKAKGLSITDPESVQKALNQKNHTGNLDTTLELARHPPRKPIAQKRADRHPHGRTELQRTPHRKPPETNHLNSHSNQKLRRQQILAHQKNRWKDDYLLPHPSLIISSNPPENPLSKPA